MERSIPGPARRQDKHSRILLALSLGCTMTMVVIFLWPAAGLLDKLEYRTVDWRFRSRGARPPAPNIVIVVIDEESIAQVGKWPWPRRTFAELTQRLADAGARAIVYDIFFVESDSSDSGKAGDQEFAAATRQAGDVYHASFGYAPDQTTTASQPTTEGLTQYAWSQVRLIRGRGLNALATGYELPALSMPFPALVEEAAGVGFTNVIDGGDGVFRYAPPLANYGGKLYPCLGLVVAADQLAVSPEQITVKLGHSIDLADLRQLPIDRGGRMAVNFAGPDQTYSYLPVREVLTAHDHPRDYDLEDRIVIVGVTAPGLHDLRACPFGGVMNGVEIQANIVDNIINAHFLKEVKPEKVISIILFMGLSVGAMFALVATWGAVTYAIGILLVYNLLCIWAFNTRGVVIDMLVPTLTALLNLLAMLIYKLTTEESQRRHVRQTLSHFVPEEIVSQLVEEEALTTMQGQRREVSVLFCDLRNFTAASERLAPEDTVALLNRYFQLMHEVIWEFGGTLDKFIGDALMAFFNAPLPQPNHAQLAVYMAIEMQRRIQFNQAEWEFYGMSQMEAGIGISTGEALVGCVSSQERMQYTVIGSHVNLAARLEELTKRYEAKILISETTYQQVKDFAAAQPVGEITVRGFAQPVKVYSVEVPA